MSSWYLGGWVLAWLLAYPQIVANGIVPAVTTSGFIAVLVVHLLEARKIEGIGLREMLWRSFVFLFSSPYWSFQMTFGISFRLVHNFVTGKAYMWPEKRS
jgi:hypothetical protein